MSLFGKEITFNKKLSRVREGQKRYWEVESIKETKGVIIGVRTLWNGYIIHESVDDGYCRVFIFEKPVKAYLVATDLIKNPIYVSPDNIL